MKAPKSFADAERVALIAQDLLRDQIATMDHKAAHMGMLVADSERAGIDPPDYTDLGDSPTDMYLQFTFFLLYFATLRNLRRSLETTTVPPLPTPEEYQDIVAVLQGTQDDVNALIKLGVPERPKDFVRH